MEPEGWLRLRELFAAAVLLAPAERASFLDRECGDDTELRREVESLLRHDPGPDAGPREAPGASSRRRPEAEATKPVAVGDRIGNIRIIEVLGAGGMGKVYVGFDETLQRKVALKAIGWRLRLRPEVRARFLREARILSQLEHPNICRIYDYLTHGDSELLVLELIDGPTLSQVIADGLGFQRKLEIAGKIAEVLAAAHSEGIVHRDLKPDNVMLTRAGEVKVLDFGLARAVEAETGEGDPPPRDVRAMVEPPVDEAGTTLDAPGSKSTAPETPGDPQAPPPADSHDRTLTSPGGTPAGAADGDLASPFPLALRTEAGSVLGTPLYMSPEQARGEVVTTASDMYSFGLLLQFLFTGESPYPGGLDARKLLGRARRGGTRPVTGVDRDVAALVEQLKSLAPAARPTAVAALERLRWIRDKPRRRLRRLIAAAVVAAVVLAGLKYTFDLRRERAIAVAAQTVAEQRRGQAEDLIGFMLGDLRGRLEPVGRLAILDEVGAKAMDYFAAVPAAELSDEELLRRSQALYQIGDVRVAQGNLPAAAEAFEQSMALARDLVERSPDNLDWLANLGNCHFWVGTVYWNRGDLQRAREELEAYRAITRDLAQADPSNRAWQMERFYGEANVGRVLEAAGDFAGAQERFTEALKILQPLAARKEPDADLLLELANAHLMLARAKKSLGDLAGAARHYELDLEILQRLIARDPEHAGWQDRLASSHSYLGHNCLRRGDLPGALEHFRSHLRIAESLALRDPDNTHWQGSLASAGLNLGHLYNDMGDPAAARRHLHRAAEIFQTLTRAEPKKSRWQRDLAQVRMQLGRSLEAEGNLHGALEETATATESLAAAAAGSQEPGVHRRLAESRLLRGRVLTAAGRREAAVEQWRLALEAIGPFGRDSRDGDLVAPLARALLRLGRRSEAEPLLARLEVQGYVDSEIERLLAASGRAVVQENRPNH